MSETHVLSSPFSASLGSAAQGADCWHAGTPCTRRITERTDCGGCFMNAVRGTAARVCVALWIGAAGAQSAVSGQTRFDGQFDSAERGFTTRLWILEGDHAALVMYTGGFLHEHSCDFGPAIVPRVSATEFEWQDPDPDVGTIRFDRADGRWNINLVKPGFGNEFGFCGAGWGGDSFRRGRAPARTCVVAAEKTDVFVASHPGTSLVPSGTTLSRHDRVYATGFFSNYEYVLARAGGALGMVKKRDLSCPAVGK
jgi:hypothetical protein